MKLLMVLPVAVTTAALQWVRHHLVRVTVVGHSMRPTLDDGDVVLARRASRRGLRPGRLVVAERPSSPSRWGEAEGPGQPVGPAWMVKRIVAIRRDGGAGDGESAALQALPPGTVYLLGDNLHASYDSRAVGPWPIDRVLGVVVCRLRRR